MREKPNLRLAVRLPASLLNLLSNAGKFTHEGQVKLEVRPGEGEISFIVSDTGIGMTEEQQGRLFQAFSQAELSTTRQCGGTGLDLAITKHFCEMLRGNITVESTRGQGSTFTITLPDHGRVTAAAAPAAPEGAEHAALVMVVDDDPNARDLLAATVRREGYRVIEATPTAYWARSTASSRQPPRRRPISSAVCCKRSSRSMRLILPMRVPPRAISSSSTTIVEP
jgi:anti-sigma regulatory factor (Ser/Thr protein kinase)